MKANRCDAADAARPPRDLGSEDSGKRAAGPPPKTAQLAPAQLAVLAWPLAAAGP
jgi:hypothetical protein